MGRSVGPLVPLPVGGKHGLGGNLPGMDWLVREQEEGGKVARIATNAVGMIAIVALDRASMLSGPPWQEHPQSAREGLLHEACVAC